MVPTPLGLYFPWSAFTTGLWCHHWNQCAPYHGHSYRTLVLSVCSTEMEVCQELGVYLNALYTAATLEMSYFKCTDLWIQEKSTVFTKLKRVFSSYSCCPSVFRVVFVLFSHRKSSDSEKHFFPNEGKYSQMHLRMLITSKVQWEWKSH